MATPPSLFDRAAVLRNRRRAAASPALFLQEAVAGEVDERLAEVNRTFTSAAIVSGWPDFWSARRPSAALIADEERLAFDPGAHDLILHAMALHWANDPVGQLVQCRLALQPDGLLIATMFGGQTLSELRAALAEAESRITGGLTPRVSPMADLRDLGGLLQRAGFAMPVADSLVLNVTYPDLGALMHDLRAMGETNAQSARLRRPTRRSASTSGESAGDTVTFHPPPTSSDWIRLPAETCDRSWPVLVTNTRRSPVTTPLFRSMFECPFEAVAAVHSASASR